MVGTNFVFYCWEAWQSRQLDIENSVHLRSYDPISPEWHNEDVAQRWTQIRRVRQVVMSALEFARNDGKIGSSLQAALQVYVSEDMLSAFAGQDAASLFITSSAILTTGTAPADAFRLEAIDGIAVGFSMAEGEKCARCWKVSREVSVSRDICDRCYNVVGKLA